MNNSKRNRPLQWIAVIAIAILFGGMIFVAGFGTGFGTGRVTAPQYASSAPSALVRPDTPPPAPAAASTLPFLNQGADVPPEFDLLWEAWDALEKDYYGDLPDTPEMVGGLVTGMLHAAEQQTDSELDREETADEVIAAVIGVLEQDLGTLPDTDRLTYGAINGVMFRLDDDYTFLRDPEQARFFNEGLSGSFEGIGARVAEAEGGGVRITEPFEGQPAWNAGIRRDDVILAVDGQDITDTALSDAITLIRGPKGSDVVLSIKSPEQEARDVTVTRDTISIPVVEYELRDDGIAYLRLGEFSSPAEVQVQAALEEMLAQNPTGLVLDLRGNPGGLLRSAVDISSEFVPDGPILIERFKDGKEQVYDATGKGQAFDIPLVVLVNEGSASASEILAGAVQDTGRGILLGTTTFGKGSVQVPHQLSDGSMLSVTTARWYTPNDRLIHGEGLEPDIVVEEAAADSGATDDLQLQAAVEYLLNGQQPSQ